MPLYMIHLDSIAAGSSFPQPNNGKINSLLNTIKLEYVLMNILN